MRILPRLNMPTRKAARRLWRKSKARLNLRRIYYSVELLLFIVIYLLVFSGSRLRTLDTFGRRTDAIVSLVLVGTFILIHVIARRSLLPKIERYYAPAPYDERKIFFDLGQGSQNITSERKLQPAHTLDPGTFAANGSRRHAVSAAIITTSSTSITASLVLRSRMWRAKECRRRC